jgi:hypothetical protein
MSFQTPQDPTPGTQSPSGWDPQPGSGTNPLPPPPAGWVQPPAPQAPKAAFDPKTVDRMDWGILAAGFLAFVFSFVSYYTVSVKGGGFSASASASAWHGFFGWFAALLAVASAGVLALTLFSPDTKLPLPVPPRQAVLVGFAVASLSVLLALVVFPGSVSAPGVSTGRGIGYFISLIVILGGTALSYLRLKATGGSLPWEKKK